MKEETSMKLWFAEEWDADEDGSEDQGGINLKEFEQMMEETSE